MSEVKEQYGCEQKRVYDELDATFQMLMPAGYALPGEAPRDAEARWLQEIAS